VARKTPLAPARRDAKPRCPKILAWIERNSTRAWREGMTRFRIAPDKAVGMPVAKLRQGQGTSLRSRARVRAVGDRRPSLRTEALALAQRLARAESRSARWIGTDAMRELSRPPLLRRLARQAGKPRTRKA
jgi:hypothetical protein